MCAQIDALGEITSSRLILEDGLDQGRKDGLIALKPNTNLYKMKFDGCFFFQTGVELIEAFFCLFMAYYVFDRDFDYGLRYLMVLVDNKVFGWEGITYDSKAMNAILRFFSDSTPAPGENGGDVGDGDDNGDDDDSVDGNAEAGAEDPYHDGNYDGDLVEEYEEDEQDEHN